MIRSLCAFAALAALGAAGVAAAQPQVIYTGPPGALPISSGAVVPAGFETFYLSGIPGAPSAGDTRAQTFDALTKLGAVLKERGYGYGDVVNVKVYLVGDPTKGGAMDFAGMNAAFKTFFGTPEQPHKPSRVTVQVAGLALPGSLVEIEMTAARPPR